MASHSFDDIIVGAGSSGSVLAARLTEDPSRTVLILESGPDYASLAATPADIRGPDVSLRDHDWRLRSLPVGGRSHPFPRGKVVGGSSAVNGAVALRGLPADYDEWAVLGNHAWAWDAVLPYFKRLEDDDLGASELHGTGGPIPIRRAKPEQFCATQRAAHESFRALGFVEVIDHNDPTSTGVGAIPLNVRDGVRISTALGYLLPVRERPNLTIVGHAHVQRVLFEGDRAVGVEVVIDGRHELIRARRVTLSAGAIHSPAILMRSGVGPREDVQRLGIDSVVDLPGVGARLVDHPGAGIYCVPREGAQHADDPNHQTMVRYTAASSDQFNDMQLFFFGRVALKGTALEKSIGERTFFACASLVKPRATGRLLITSLDPTAAPGIDLNFNSELEDRLRMVEGIRFCWQAVHESPLADRIERIPYWKDSIFKASDEALADAMAHSVGTAYHPTGTARMGVAEDEGAVVDELCRVHGVEGLRVVDASVMPAIPRANTNLPCIMIGERVADWMRQDS
ncbi:MAG TPA: GMC family oxidoreductase N-terminal domain-containing protein [Polyangiales bacterium]|nr:GMC family oxidoreductase N-terminal domain-containing protein [Polyangiales bacterium]